MAETDMPYAGLEPMEVSIPVTEGVKREADQKGDLAGHEVVAKRVRSSAPAAEEKRIGRKEIDSAFAVWGARPEDEAAIQSVMEIFEKMPVVGGSILPPLEKVTKSMRERTAKGKRPSKARAKKTSETFKAACIDRCLRALDEASDPNDAKSSEETAKMAPFVARVIEGMKKISTSDEITAAYLALKGRKLEELEEDPLLTFVHLIEQRSCEKCLREEERKISSTVALVMDKKAAGQVLTEKELSEVLVSFFPFEAKKILAEVLPKGASLDSPQNRALVHDYLARLGGEELTRRIRYPSTMRIWDAYLKAGVEIPETFMPHIDSLLEYAIGNKSLNAGLHTIPEDARTKAQEIVHDISYYTTEEGCEIRPIVATARSLQEIPSMRQLHDSIGVFTGETEKFEGLVLRPLIEKQKRGEIPPELQTLIDALAVDEDHVRSEVIFSPSRARDLEALETFLSEVKAGARVGFPAILGEIDVYINFTRVCREQQRSMTEALQNAEALYIPKEAKLTLRQTWFLTHFAKLHSEYIQHLPVSQSPRVGELRADMAQMSTCVEFMGRFDELPAYFPGDIILTNARIEDAVKGRPHEEGYWSAAKELVGKWSVPHQAVNAGYNHAAPVVSDSLEKHPERAVSEGPFPATFDMNMRYGMVVGSTSVESYIIEESFHPVLTKIVLPQTLEMLKAVWGTQDLAIIEQKLQDMYRTCVAQAAKEIMGRKGRFVENERIMLRTYVNSWVDFFLRSTVYATREMRKVFRAKRTGVRPPKMRGEEFQQIILPKEVGDQTVPFTCARHTATLVCLAQEKLNQQISLLVDGGPDSVCLFATFPPEYPARSIMPLDIRELSAATYEHSQRPLVIRQFVHIPDELRGQ